MAVEIITPENKTVWKGIRTEFITATDIVAIKGASPWKTPIQVLHDKLGYGQEAEWNPAMAAGTILEPFIRGHVAARQGWGDPSTWHSWGEKIWIDRTRHIAATPDGLFGPAEAMVLHEIKTSQRPWKELPERVRLQILFQAGLTGAKIALCSHLTVPEEIATEIVCRQAAGENIWPLVEPLLRDIETVPVPLPQEIEGLLTFAEDWFTAHVLMGLPLPEQIAPEKVPAPKGVIENQELLAQWAQLKERERAFEAQVKQVKDARAQAEAKIAELLGDKANALVSPMGKLSRAWINGRINLDAEGLVKAIVAKHPELTDEVKAMEGQFTTFGVGYNRWTYKEAK